MSSEVYQAASYWFSVVTEPGRVLLVVALVGAILLWTRWQRAGRWLVSAGLLLLVLISSFPVPALLFALLEDRIPAPTSLPEAVAGIIVLGGSTEPGMRLARGGIALNNHSERILEGLALARRFPEAMLLFTGGGARLAPGVPTEADDTAALLDALGFDRSRVVFEDRSANTYESAVMSARLVTPKPGEVWLLVTSAAHMPRSVGAFRKAGWDPLPYPVDYSTYGSLPAFVPALPDPSGHLHAVRDAVHEFLGLLIYRLLGRSSALFPGP